MKKAAKNKLLPSRSKRGLKLAPPDLAEFIRLANLVPRGTFLPDIVPRGQPVSWVGTLERILELPSEVQAELMAACSKAPDDFWRVSRVYGCYDKIRVAYLHLGMLSRDESESIDALESLMSTLRFVEPSYLRRCEVCNRIFYAKRKTQKGCTTKHSTILRKREKYARDKANREYKKRKGEK